MKKTILFLALILSMIICSNISAQSQNTREIEVNNDEEKIFIRYENDELTKLVVDGKRIQPENFSLYNSLIKKYSKNDSDPPVPTPPKNNSQDADSNENEECMQKLQSILIEKNRITNPDKFKIALTADGLKVNGVDMDEQTLNLCLDALESVFDYRLSAGDSFKVKRNNNLRSISFVKSN